MRHESLNMIIKDVWYILVNQQYGYENKQQY